MPIPKTESAAKRLADMKNKKEHRLNHAQRADLAASIAQQKATGDGFRRVRTLGCGSFGSVSEVMSTRTGEIMAAKCIRITQARSEHEAAENEKKIRAAQAEIDAMTVARHPHVVDVLGHYIDRRSCEIVMLLELVPGRSISDVLLSVGKFSEAVVRRYTRQMLLGVQHMHALGCVHRDIKGQNVLLTTDSVAKLADFGGARFQKPRAPNEPASKLKPDWADFLYTPRWAAPELRHALFSPKSDIWALACVVLEMASGREPWHEYDSRGWNGEQLLCFVGDHDVTPTIPKELSAQGQQFVRWALTRDPASRPDATMLLLHPWLTGDASASGEAELAHVGGTIGAQQELAQLERIRSCIQEHDGVKTMTLQLHAAAQQQQQQQQQQPPQQRQQFVPSAAAAARMLPSSLNAQYDPPEKGDYSAGDSFLRSCSSVNLGDGQVDRSEAVLRVPAGAKYPQDNSGSRHGDGAGGSGCSIQGGMSDSSLWGDSSFSGYSVSDEGSDGQSNAPQQQQQQQPQKAQVPFPFNAAVPQHQQQTFRWPQ